MSRHKLILFLFVLLRFQILCRIFSRCKKIFKIIVLYIFSKQWKNCRLF